MPLVQSETQSIHIINGLESLHGMHTHRPDTLTSIAMVVNLMMSDMSSAKRYNTLAVTSIDNRSFFPSEHNVLAASCGLKQSFLL
jgi:hypothetical protein